MKRQIDRQIDRVRERALKIRKHNRKSDTHLLHFRDGTRGTFYLFLLQAAISNQRTITPHVLIYYELIIHRCLQLLLMFYPRQVLVFFCEYLQLICIYTYLLFHTNFKDPSSTSVIIKRKGIKERMVPKKMNQYKMKLIQ